MQVCICMYISKFFEVQAFNTKNKNYFMVNIDTLRYMENSMKTRKRKM